MKRIFIISSLVLSLFAFNACQDAYEVDPKDEIFEENAFTNIDDLEKGLNGVYIGVPGTSLIDFTSKFVDDLTIGADNRGQGIQVFTWSVNNGTTEPQTAWNAYYGGINRANRIIEAAENLEVIDEDQERKDLVIAQCKALRAHMHFDLLRLFAQDYEPNSLAVPIVDRVWVFEQPARNTVQEVTDFIKSDLDDASAVLDYTPADNKRISGLAIDAIRARLSLYIKDYDNAITYATNVINATQLTQDLQAYVDVWADLNETGVVFKLARTVGQGTIGTLFTDTDGTIFFNPSEEIFNVLIANGLTDDHRTFSILDTNSFTDIETAAVGKYLGTDANPGLNDIKLYRGAEAYLIRAEANVRKSAPDLAAAAADIETLQNARKENTVTVSFSDVTQALDVILTERRLELAYEGHRYFDLKRFGLGVERNANDCDNAAGACDLESTSHLWSLPIPQSEIFANDNMEQNNGY